MAFLATFQQWVSTLKLPSNNSLEKITKTTFGKALVGPAEIQPAPLYWLSDYFGSYGGRQKRTIEVETPSGPVMG
jgi:hypothetical protein